MRACGHDHSRSLCPWSPPNRTIPVSLRGALLTKAAPTTNRGQESRSSGLGRDASSTSPQDDPAAEGQPDPNTYSVRGWPVPLVDAAPALDAERVQRVAPGLMAAGCAAVLRLPALASPLEALKKSVAATKSKSAARDGAKAKKPAPKKRAAAGRK
jgi:hypothetical protein